MPPVIRSLTAGDVDRIISIVSGLREWFTSDALRQYC